MHRMPLAVLRMTVKKEPPPRDFPAALTQPDASIIAELKKASPSRGVLREEFQPKELAAGLAAAGAAALSVLTEEEYFQGSIAHLRAARAAAPVPVLRKDFILDPWQVWETRAAGADSLLLIAAALTDAELAGLLVLARELGMEPLIEVHNAAELDRALAAGAGIVGVNNRDLATFTARLDTSFSLVECIPDDCIAVSESGIHCAEDVARLSAAGFDAFLVGEHLMQSPEPAAALRRLLGEAV